MKKILLTTIASTLLATTIGGVAHAGAFSGTSTIWAWNINVPPLKAVAKSFMKLHPQAHIKIVARGHDDLYEKLSAGLVAHGKGLPDSTLMEDDHFDSFIKIYPSSFVDVGKMGFSKLANLFPAYKIQSASYKSRIYGLPFGIGPAMIFYRRSIFAKAGVKPSQIKTWDDFIKYGKIIKAKTGKYMFSGSDGDGIYRIMAGQYGKGYYDSKGNIDLKNPISVRAWKLIQKMANEGILHHSGAGWDTFMREIATGTIVAIPSGVWLEGNIEIGAPKTKGDWGVFPLPVNGDGDVASAFNGGTSFVMLKKSRNKALTYNFLKYFTTETQSQLVSFKAGLFPTLKKVYKTKEFNAGVPFFHNQKVWLEAAKASNSMKAVNFTEDYYYANLELSKLFSGVIFTGGDLMKRLDQSVHALQARTGRKVHQYK